MYAYEIGKINEEPYGAAETTPKGLSPPAGKAPKSFSDAVSYTHLTLPTKA